MQTFILTKHYSSFLMSSSSLVKEMLTVEIRDSNKQLKQKPADLMVGSHCSEHTDQCDTLKISPQGGASLSLLC